MPPLQLPPLPAPMAMGPVAVEAPYSPPPSPRGPAPARAAFAAALNLCFASFWVANASLVAGFVVALAVPGSEVRSAVNEALYSAYLTAILCTVLFALVAGLLVRFAPALAGFRVDFTKACGLPAGSSLQGTAWLVVGAFSLLFHAGFFLVLVMLPAKESMITRIGALMVRVGAVGLVATFYFVILPTIVWRKYLGCGTAAGSI